MAITLQDAISDLYQVAVVQGRKQSTQRCQTLANFCVQELDQRGLRGALLEQTVQGGGRPKNWDIAWLHDGKHRLVISLKSILQNLPGTVPNRVDDLMGEVTNVQLFSPEIVTGYLMIMDISSDATSILHRSTWADLFDRRLGNLSGRRSPHWTIGTIEAHALIRVNFASSPLIVPPIPNMDNFFDTLTEQVKMRNPNALGG